MTSAGATAHTLLDDAWIAVLAGKRDDGLRTAVALLEDDPLQLGAGALVAQVLATDRPAVAAKAAAWLVDAFVRRGDLPSAAAAALTVGEAGGDAGALHAAIAAAFGKGSGRLSDVPPAPPPLPAAPALEAALRKLAGKALLGRAEKALDLMMAAADPIAAGKVPALPLFSALAPPVLERLLGTLARRTLAGGAVAIEQGAEGREAFIVVRGALQAVRRAQGQDDSVLAVLGPGAIFGEMALVSDAPRAAAVVALEPVELLVAARDPLEAIARTEPAIARELASFCRRRMMANLVRHSAILGAVPAAEREGLVARFEVKTFQPGEVLVVEGAEAAGLYLVASGQVRVAHKDAEGDSIVLAELGPGDVVGEISLVLRRPASATVTASHPTVALHLPRDRFHEAIREHASLLAELYELATRRDEETRSVVAQQALDVEDVVLL